MLFICLHVFQTLKVTPMAHIYLNFKFWCVRVRTCIHVLLSFPHKFQHFDLINFTKPILSIELHILVKTDLVCFQGYKYVRQDWL